MVSSPMNSLLKMIIPRTSEHINATTGGAVWGTNSWVGNAKKMLFLEWKINCVCGFVLYHCCFLRLYRFSSCPFLMCCFSFGLIQRTYTKEVTAGMGRATDGVHRVPATCSVSTPWFLRPEPGGPVGALLFTPGGPHPPIIPRAVWK